MTMPGGLLDRMFPRSQPVEGLITDEDYKNAQRMGLLQLGAGLLAGSGPSTQPRSLGQIAGQAFQGAQEGYQGGIDQLMQRRLGIQKFQGEQNEQKRKQAVLAARERIVAENPMPMQQGGMTQWIDKVYPLFVASGDDEMISRLTQVRSSIGNQHMAQKIEEVVGPDGKPAFGHVTPEGVKIIPGAAPFQRASTPARPRMVTLINPKTGKPEIALMDPVSGDFEFTGQVPGSSRDAGGTESERKAGAQLKIVTSMVGILDQADSPDRITRFISQQGLNEFVGANRQRLEHAGMVVAEVFLRSMTGANAPENEVRTYMTMITPQPGDDKSLIAQKRQLRRTWVEAIKISAGRTAERALEDTRPPLSSFNLGGGK